MELNETGDFSVFDDEIQKAQEEAARKRKFALVASALEGFVTARGRARGAPDQRGDFYTQLGNMANDPVNELQGRKKQAIHEYFMKKRAGQQADALEYQKGRDAVKDDQWQQGFDKTGGKSQQMPFTMGYDPVTGRRTILDRRSGVVDEAKLNIIGDQGGDAPMQPKPNESKIEFNQRVKEEWEKRSSERPKSFKERMGGLGAEERKRVDGANMGYDASIEMENAIKEGTNKFSIVGDNDFTFARTKWEEAIGRMQSGGAINKDEEARFRSMAPTVGDNKDIVDKKIEWMKKEMKTRLGNLGFSPDEFKQPQKKRTFPSYLQKDGKRATVTNESELKEALADGWK